MYFIETPLFTKEIRKLLSDETYRELQGALILRPDQGSLIQGSGGLRKIRWNISGSGKRGGVRVIYYWISQEETFYMLYVYPKNAQEDLTKTQLKLLSQAVREEFQ